MGSTAATLVLALVASLLGCAGAGRDLLALPECQPNLSRTEYLYMFSMPCRVNNQLRCTCPLGYSSCPSGANTYCQQTPLPTCIKSSTTVGFEWPCMMSNTLFCTCPCGSTCTKGTRGSAGNKYCQGGSLATCVSGSNQLPTCAVGSSLRCRAVGGQAQQCRCVDAGAECITDSADPMVNRCALPACTVGSGARCRAVSGQAQQCRCLTSNAQCISNPADPAVNTCALPPCTVGNPNQFCTTGGGNTQTCRCIAANTLTCDAYTGWTCQAQGFTPNSVQRLCGQQDAPDTCGTTPPDSPFTTCSCQGGTCFPGGKCQYPCGFIGAPSATCGNTHSDCLCPSPSSVCRTSGPNAGTCQCAPTPCHSECAFCDTASGTGTCAPMLEAQGQPCSSNDNGQIDGRCSGTQCVEATCSSACHPTCTTCDKSTGDGVCTPQNDRAACNNNGSGDGYCSGLQCVACLSDNTGCINPAQPVCLSTASPPICVPCKNTEDYPVLDAGCGATSPICLVTSPATSNKCVKCLADASNTGCPSQQICDTTTATHGCFPVCSDTLDSPSIGCVAPSNWKLHYTSTTVGAPNYVTSTFTCIDGTWDFAGNQFLYAFRESRTGTRTVNTCDNDASWDSDLLVLQSALYIAPGNLDAAVDSGLAVLTGPSMCADTNRNPHGPSNSLGCTDADPVYIGPNLFGNAFIDPFPTTAGMWYYVIVSGWQLQSNPALEAGPFSLNIY